MQTVDGRPADAFDGASLIDSLPALRIAGLIQRPEDFAATED